jgi:ATP-dependent protease ClpP protease subunit
MNQNEKEKKITQSAQVVSIDIDGIIGVPEQEQFGVVDSRVATYEHFAEALEEVREGGADKLVLNIRSTGGDVNDALLIYEAVRSLGIQVITRCYGYVASAATIIAQAASAGCREISANSLYLIHCCESAVEGNSHNLSATQQLLEKSDQRLADIYAEASGREADSFRALMNENGGRGKWLTPEEVIEAGLADVVIASAAISNDASGQVASLGLPPLPQPKRTLRERIVDNCTSILSKVSLGSRFVEGLRRSVGPAEKAPLPHSSSADNAVVDVRPMPTSRLMTARATLTLPAEDPLPATPLKTCGNESAYQNDFDSMREALRVAAAK